MKKEIVRVVGILILFSIGCNLMSLGEKKGGTPDGEPIQEQEFLLETYDTSKEYLALRLRTDNILVNAVSFEGYDHWNTEMSILIEDWKAFEDQAGNLESMANAFAQNGSVFVPNHLIEMDIIYASNMIQSPEKQEQKYELTNIFDNAPAGKKIATLAKYLGTDAKRAYALLQQEQGIITADAYNEAGDTLQKLETTAVVIKDTCKVAGFVIATHLSAGTAPTLLSQASFIIGGADMVLEIGEDGANIALGNNNKVSAIIGDARKITEPVASILTLTTTSFDKPVDVVNAFMFEADQLRSGFQDGKIMGISIPIPGIKKEGIKTPVPTPMEQATKETGQEPTEEISQPVIATVFEPDEIDEWFEENDYPMIEEQLTEAEIGEALGVTLPNKFTESSTEPTPFFIGGLGESEPETGIDLSGFWAIQGLEDQSLYNVNLSCDEDRAGMMTLVTIKFLPLLIMGGNFEYSSIDGTYHFVDLSSSEHLTTTGSAQMLNDEILRKMKFSESDKSDYSCDFDKNYACEWFTYPGSTVCEATFKEYSTPEAEMELEGYHPTWKLSGGTITCTYERVIWQYRLGSLGVDTDIRYPCLGTVTVSNIKAYIYEDLPITNMFTDY